MTLAAKAFLDISLTSAMTIIPIKLSCLPTFDTNIRSYSFFIQRRRDYQVITKFLKIKRLYKILHRASVAVLCERIRVFIWVLHFVARDIENFNLQLFEILVSLKGTTYQNIPPLYSKWVKSSPRINHNLSLHKDWALILHQKVYLRNYSQWNMASILFYFINKFKN